MTLYYLLNVFEQNADFSMFMTTYGIFEKLMLCSCSRSAARQARDKLKHMKPELYSEDGASASGGGGGSGEDSDDDDEGEASGSTVLAEYLAPLKKNGEDFYSTDALDQDGVRGKWNEFKDAKVYVMLGNVGARARKSRSDAATCAASCSPSSAPRTLSLSLSLSLSLRCVSLRRYLHATHTRTHFSGLRLSF